MTDDVILNVLWPEENMCNIYDKNLIVNVCQDAKLLNEHSHLSEVKHHIKQNIKFAKEISDLVSCPLSSSYCMLITTINSMLPGY